MAAGDRIIRLTYEELHDLAQKYKKSTMGNNFTSSSQ